MPRRYLLSLFVLTFLLVALGSPVLSQAQSQLPYWTEAAQPTVARQELYSEVLNGKIYVVSGLLSPNTGFSAHFESYNPVNNAWLATAFLCLGAERKRRKCSDSDPRSAGVAHSVSAPFLILSQRLYRFAAIASLLFEENRWVNA